MANDRAPAPGSTPRSRSGRPGSTVRQLAVVGVLVVIALVVAAIRPRWHVRYQLLSDYSQRPFTPPPPPSALPTGAYTAAPAPAVGALGWVGPLLLILLVGVLVLVLVVWLIRRYARGRSRAEEQLETRDAEPELPVLRRGAAEAERRLLGGGDPTDAIITAWQALEEAAAGSGAGRAPSQTPTEFTVAVLGRTGIDPAPVRSLLGLYQRARFSLTGADADDLVAARRCVRELAAAWQSFDLDAAPEQVEAPR